MKRIAKGHYVPVCTEYYTMVGNFVKETSIVNSTSSIEIVKLIDKGYWIKHNIQFSQRTKTLLMALPIALNGYVPLKRFIDD